MSDHEAVAASRKPSEDEPGSSTTERVRERARGSDFYRVERIQRFHLDQIQYHQAELEKLRLQQQQLQQQQLQRSAQTDKPSDTAGRSSHDEPTPAPPSPILEQGSSSSMSASAELLPNPSTSTSGKRRARRFFVSLERRHRLHLEEIKLHQAALEKLRLQQQQLQSSAQTDKPSDTAGISSHHKPTPAPLPPESFEQFQSGSSQLPLKPSTSTRAELTAGGSSSLLERLRKQRIQEMERAQVKQLRLSQQQLQHSAQTDEPSDTMTVTPAEDTAGGLDEPVTSHHTEALQASASSEDKTEVMEGPSCFTPEVIKGHGGISYRFRGPGPGVFQCDMTKLVFKMTGAGELTYRVVWWDVELLSTAGKTPAGLLFDIKCPEDAVSQLHLPHCETELAPLSEGLSVVHISHDGMVILKPQEITDTHVIVDVPHLSAFGLVWDIFKNVFNKPINGQVLLFHQPPSAESPTLYVFLLPDNVPMQEVKGQLEVQLEEVKYILAPSSCYFIRKQSYSVDCPEADLVQPEDAVYDFNYGPNYHPTFEIELKDRTKSAVVIVQDQEKRRVWKYKAKLTGLKEASSSASLSSQRPPSEPALRPVLVEEGCSASFVTALSKLSLTNEPDSPAGGGGGGGGGPDPCGQSLPRRGKYEKKLFSVRKEFIARVSTSVLKDLMDALLQDKVINDGEKESIPAEPRTDKARELIDMVIRKGDTACRLLIQTFCEVDPFVSKVLKLN